MIDGSVLQSDQRCFEKKSRVVVKMVVTVTQKTFPRNISSNFRNNMGKLIPSVVGGTSTRGNSILQIGKITFHLLILSIFSATQNFR